MDTTAITAEHMLDALADFQAQADYLEMQKRELLDAVKIPAEVLQVQDDANKRRKELDQRLFEKMGMIATAQREAITAIKDPEMPPEYVAAIKAAQLERAKIQSHFSMVEETERQAILSAKEQVDIDLQAKTANVYREVEIRKQEIAAEFEDKGAGVKENIAKLTAEIKATVKAIGKTIKGQFYQAVYVKGRTTWKTDDLDTVYFDLNAVVNTLQRWDSPEGTLLGERIAGIIEKMTGARKVGEPSITLRSNK